jgi:hypothetical protein
MRGQVFMAAAAKPSPPHAHGLHPGYVAARALPEKVTCPESRANAGSPRCLPGERLFAPLSSHTP